MKWLIGFCVSLSFLLVMACDNPVLAIVQYKVAHAAGDPDISITYLGLAAPSGSTADIGSAQTGGTPKTVTFTIINNGSGPLTLSGTPVVAISGADSSSFVQASLPNATVPAGQNSSFSIEFSPASVGVKIATISVSSDDPDTPTYSIIVTGVGVASSQQDIRVLQGSVNLDLVHAFNFGDFKAGTTSDVVFTIRNVGTPGSYVQLDTIDFQGGDAARFSITTPPDKFALGVADSTTFTVRFSPTAGAETDFATTMHITCDDPDESDYTVAITGGGLMPHCKIIQGTTDIADGGTYTAMGALSADGPGGAQPGAVTQFAIVNTGQVPLNVSGVSLAGTIPVEFTIEESQTGLISAGAQETFSIRFDPSFEGTRTETVTVSTDALAPADSYTFGISGTGTFAKKVYWVGKTDKTIYRANLTGTVKETVLSGLTAPTGLAIDQVNNIMYFGDGNKVYTAPLDGSGSTEIINLPGAPSPQIYGVSIDSNYVFLTTFAGSSLGIWRANLNGTGVTGSMNEATYGIVADANPTTGKVYWSTDSGFVNQANKSAISGVLLTYDLSISNARGMAYDAGSGKVYWGFKTGEIACCTPPGPASVLADVPDGTCFLALDVADNYIFWTNENGKVYRGALNNPASYSVIATGSGPAMGIALDLVD